MVHEILHTIDPEGDVVLVLRNPKAPFAVWKDYDWAAKSKDSMDNLDNMDHMFGNNSKKGKKGKKDKKKSHDIWPLSSVQEPAPEPPEDIVSPDIPAPECPCIEPGAGEDSPSVQNANIDDETEIKFLLSSRHLVLASRYFNAKLNGTWKEATPHPVDRRYHLEASDWDPDALLILMQVIHGRMRSVPRRIGFEMLAKIAVLVDYYDCHEVMEVISSIWIDALKGQLPSECNRDLVLWLLISHVFQQDDIFSRITKTAVLEGQGPLPTMDLPIPSIIIDLIDWRRQDAIGFILNVLDDVLVCLRNGSAGCGYECSCMLLGALYKKVHEHNLTDRGEPYLGYGVKATEKRVRGFKSPVWHRGYDEYSYDEYSHKCTLLQLFESRFDSEFAKNKEGFTLAEAAMSDVSRREGKGKGNDDALGLSEGTNRLAL